MRATLQVELKGVLRDDCSVARLDSKQADLWVEKKVDLTVAS